MSEHHPIIAITGSSGAGTTSVTRTFEAIFIGVFLEIGCAILAQRLLTGTIIGDDAPSARRRRVVPPDKGIP